MTSIDSSLILAICFLPLVVAATTRQGDSDDVHHSSRSRRSVPKSRAGPWLNTDWLDVARQEIASALHVAASVNTKRAKNVIMFLGDGMGFPTVAAARVYNSQLRSKQQQDIYLTWEKFPHVGLSRTYNVDRSTPDSAGTATAYLCGVKGNYATIGVTDQVLVGNCSVINNNKLRSIAKESITQGKWTGVVTTTRITHASPAGCYANTPDRNWESSIPDETIDRHQCQDIAYQLTNDPDNQHIRVLLGGGRSMLIPNNETDSEFGTPGNRRDGNNLIKHWINTRTAKGESFAFVSNLTEFTSVDPAQTDYLMGLFNPSHMDYEMDRIEREPIREPSLSEMTEKAIKILQRSSKGYFLFVEGGRIDHAHHDNLAHKALNDTLAFSDAVQKAVELTSSDDTLIVVTADHSHVFSFGGYATFEPSVLDFTDGDTSTDGKPCLQLNYANGPGYYYHRQDENGNESPRKNLIGVDIMDKDFVQDAGIPMYSETHGGEDVGIYSSGPWSHLFHGNHEQNYIAHVMMYASCVGPWKDEAHCTH